MDVNSDDIIDHESIPLCLLSRSNERYTKFISKWFP